MTRQEAVKVLIDMANMLCLNPDTPQGVALKMAIKALEEQDSVLDKIKAEFISLYPKNYAGELEFGGLGCEFSLNKVLKVIDKYKAECEEQA